MLWTIGHKTARAL